MDTIQRDAFLTRYMAMWHEPDAARRHGIIHSLFAANAENFTRTMQLRGLAEITGRVDRSHTEWVANKGFIFRPTGNTDAHNHLIKFNWEMVPKGGGAAEAKGLDIMVLDGEGRIQALYQFNEPT
jgi:hypothetical protein